MHFLFNYIEGKMMEGGVMFSIFYSIISKVNHWSNFKHNALPHVTLILPGHGSDKRKQH